MKFPFKLFVGIWLILWFLLGFLIGHYLVPAKAHAAEVYGFMDGKYYDESQSLKYFCFLDRSCFDVSGKQVNLAEVIPGYIDPVKPNLTPTAPLGATPSTQQQIDFAKELRWVQMQPGYVNFGFVRADTIRQATYKLTINDNLVLTQGNLVSEKKVVNLTFNGTFEAGIIYNIKLEVTSADYVGTYTTQVSF